MVIEADTSMALAFSADTPIKRALVQDTDGSRTEYTGGTL